MISMNYKFISEITIENQIVDQKNLFSIGFSPEINGYLMVVLVCWIAHYQRCLLYTYPSPRDVEE